MFPADRHLPRDGPHHTTTFVPSRQHQKCPGRVAPVSPDLNPSRRSARRERDYLPHSTCIANGNGKITAHQRKASRGPSTLLLVVVRSALDGLLVSLPKAQNKDLWQREGISIPSWTGGFG